MSIQPIRITSAFLCFSALTACSTQQATSPETYVNMQPGKLFADLPDSCPTPDAFAINPKGGLTLSCPNFADGSKPGMLLHLSDDGEVSEIGTIPGHRARPMGLAWGDDGALYVANNAGKHQGSVLRLSFNGNKIEEVEVVATGLSSPNGLRYYNGQLYLTQLQLPKAKTPKLSSAIYRFKSTDRNIQIASDLSSNHILFKTQTQNPSRQFGLDGLVFDSKGNLFVGDFGDAKIYKLELNSSGELTSSSVFAQLPLTTGIDGLAIDNKDNLYLAGFLQNQIYKVNTKGTYSLIADYDDNDGSNGQIDQPADVIVYNNKLFISNFDLMKGPGMINSGHSKPYTISYIDL
ncbi:SMP-30/gluconolactonase/LRE family protein [Saccharophagus degradans]|uniref:SMP-30/gluconolactonase/LRE family protein n=1 Tax=Saccharophagus degradans TaxID=86304 RepID=A0AAW7X7V2_9GAMM|nr:SMP-30/gluconolactonase/LRE family protein [Saccharophagus degradans]MDO6422562.1 SMP-30/gluconolactonase/LRE family protein [Saccharophagus degradans]MDO6609130.1 SMP-30/gluconolactonase/LRE family protein [Saccharophagus degradans]